MLFRDLHRKVLGRFDFVPCRSDKNFLWNRTQPFWSMKRAYRTQLQTCTICRFYPENFILCIMCLCVKIRKGSRYFRILDSYIEDRFLISEAQVLPRGSLCGICCRQVFVAVMFLSEYHRSCRSTTDLVPSTTDRIRVHSILSEYHCSCPSTSDLVRVPQFLSEYIWSCPSTIVLVRVQLFLP